MRILIVDDEPDLCIILSHWLCSAGYLCKTANNTDTALSLLAMQAFELVISDIMMPGKSGLELIQEVKKIAPDTAVIMVTAMDNQETALDALQLGAFGYLIKPVDKNVLLINVANALDRRITTLDSQKHERELEQMVLERTAAIRAREEEIFLRLVWASEYRDDDTGAHIRRIGLYSAELAEALGWLPMEVDSLRITAPMHDVGKIGVPDAILLKPGKLTVDEFAVVKKHTTIGASILAGSEIPLLHLAKDIALSHHEKWDGSGYPEGLRAEQIPMAARIVAIADVYDALMSDRVYRKAMPEEKALAIMQEGRGTHFDPAIFDSFLAILPRFRQIVQTTT
ncbi:MAG: response regulator [Deltaproteobacteria bacterium RIFOXYD12_FULL_50_9]|nr:MAG: response regulator [Deltaproteobacteria bacterium RIFOXYD12_FULL_50_9]